jgi:peptidoglycan/LPS O-acetylase OafA/YrhL
LFERSKNSSYDFWQFFIERFARIYSGLIPALVLIILIDCITIYLTGEPTIVRYFTLKTLIANLFMLESYRGVFSNALQWSAFGSASPLWTLAIEWHIYIFVATVFFMLKRPRSILWLLPFALFFGQTPVHFLFGSYQPDGVGCGLFLLWIGGSIVYFAVRRIELSQLANILLIAVATPAFVWLEKSGEEYRLAAYPFLILGFFGLVSLTQSTATMTTSSYRSIIRFAADYSFSLYLVHHSIMLAISLIFPYRGLTVLTVAIVASNIAAFLLAEIGEKRHRKFADILKTAWSRRTLAARA